MISLLPIANFAPFDPSKVQSYRNRRAMILASIAVAKVKKIKTSGGGKKKVSSDPLASLSPMQKAMFALAIKEAKK